jgi:hypothetical protein|tara:strand:+ start:245 stop:2110 length:1866 start_codon:yes stop_codon:yes gene_type:complete
MKGKQMAHYKVKGKSRLTTRTATVDPQWLAVCSHIGRQVNNWAWRSDLAVYGGEDSAEGMAVAAYYADISEIEVNLTKAFGEFTPAEFVGNFTEQETQLDFPMATGILYHEAMHARHTAWDIEYLATQLDNSEAQAFMLLEEGRIEAKGMIERPEMKNFLRTSGLEMALEGVNEEYLSTMSDLWATANLAGLAIARVDSGVLEVRDIQEIYNSVVAILGKELFEELRKVWIAFQKLTVPEVEQSIVLAKKWVELLREADPEGEGSQPDPFGEEGEGEGEGEEGEGKGEGMSEAMQSLAGKLAEASDQTQDSASDSMQEQKTKDKWNEEAKARQSEAQKNNQRKAEAREVFHKQHNQDGTSGSASTVTESRQPTGAERASAVQIAKSLEKAKYRERSVHIRKSQAPVGKLIARNAVQNKAMESMGLRGELPTWKAKSRKHTDDPTLRLGIMVDISGSMGMAMEAMGQTAWIMSEAGRRIQAETAMIYYGSGIFPTLKRGQRLSEVTIYSAPDGTEKFGEAFRALDGELGLTFGDGVRILVVVSDGNYTPKQTEQAVQLLRECKQTGVAVLWITPKGCQSYGARNIISESAWGVHLDSLETDQIANLVGKSASEALARVGSLT